MSWTQSSSPSHSRQLWLLFLLVLLASGGLYYVLTGQAHQQALRAAAAQAQLQAQLQTQLDRLHQRANITELTVRDLAADSVTTRQLTVTGATNLQDLFASSLTTSGNLSSASLGSDSANFGTLLVRGATTLAGPTRFKDTATFAKIIDLGVLRLTGNDRDLVLIQPSVNNGQNVFVLRSPTGAELAALTASGNLSLAGGLTAAAVTTATATISGVLNVTQADITQANINAANIGTLTTTGQATFTATPVGTLVNQGSLYINPASAGAADTLLGLAVAGTQKFKVDASGNVYANNIVLNGSVTSGNTTASNLTVLNNTVLGTTAANTTTVNSTTTFNAPVTNNGSLTQNGISTFNSNVTVAANLNVSGATTISGPLTVSGAASFTDSVTIAGASPFTVGTGLASFGGNVSIAGTLNVSGNAALLTLQTSGAATLNSLAVTNNAIVGGNLAVTGNGTFTGSVTASSFNGPINGTITPTGFTQGSVVFAGAGGTLAQDSANFFWDNVNKRLGVGTGTPTSKLEVSGQISSSAGSLAVPSYSFSGNLNAGLYSPFANQIAFSVGGLQALRLDDIKDAYFGGSLYVNAGKLIGLTGNSTTHKLYNQASNNEDVFQYNEGFRLDRYNGGTPINTLYASSGGNIGIGTTTPNEQIEITGNFRLPTTTATTGIIKVGANNFIHAYGTNNFFAGISAGNTSLTGSYNTGVGASALAVLTSGTYNTAIGDRTLQSNTTGYNNTALGANALFYNTTGFNNTSVGQFSLLNNTTGTYNTALGANSLFNNTTGDSNVAVGQNALYSATNTSNSVAIGRDALYSNTTGYNNVAIGRSALQSNTTGFSNTATGIYALVNNTTGANNVALGYQAGYTATPANANVTGNNNTFIGYNSGPGIATQLQNATAIGYNSLVSSSNSLILGGTGADAVNVGIGTTMPAYELDVSGGTGIVGQFSGRVIGGNAVNSNEFTTKSQLDAVTGGTGSTGAFVQNGNSFGALAILGTNDAFNLGFETNNVTRCTLSATDGSFSCPGAGATSERFGAGATAAGASTVAIGNGASATDLRTTVLGASANAASGSDGSVVIGYQASSNNVNSVALGRLAVASNNSVIAIGINSTASDTGSVSIGSFSAAAGSYGVALGSSSSAGHLESIAIGRSAITTANQQLVIGGSANGLTSGYFGNGVTAATPNNFAFNATGGSGTNIAGASLTLAGGKGTGNAAGGSLFFQTSDAGATGATLQSLSTKMTILANGNVGIGTTTPSNRLHIVGPTVNGGNGGYAAYLDSTLASTGAGAANGLRINNSYATLLSLETNGTPILTVRNDDADTLSVTNASNSRYTATFTNAPAGLGRVLHLVSGSIAAGIPILQADNNSGPVFGVYADGNVGIGTTIPGAQLAQTIGAAGTIGHIIKGAASQTADLLQAQDSTGAVLVKIDAGGNLTVMDAVVRGTLSVTGAVTLSSTLTVGDNVTFNGNVASFSNNVRGIDQAITTAATTLAVTFGTAYPDANYAVNCTANYNTTCFVTGKATTGFTLNFGTAAPASSTVDWFVAH